MKTQIVEILPREIKFIFEVKKQSSCTIHLTNVTEQYVAFKVKTTSPKKYCVRPNVGIIKPKSTCDFVVTMQAQKSAPLELQCKDKFLIQSTVVPFGTTEEAITSDMFAKDTENYIEETKIRVVLTSAPNSPGELPVHEILKQEESHETFLPEEPNSHVLLPVNGISKQEPYIAQTVQEAKLQPGVENLPPPTMLVNYKANAMKTVNNLEESKSLKVKDGMKSVPAKSEEFYPDKNDESKQAKNVEAMELKLTDINELQLKISSLDSKLIEAECTIMKLKEEKLNATRETEFLQHELVGDVTEKEWKKKSSSWFPTTLCMHGISD
ncbi:vesicle-associated protein 2-2-like [Dorcoceras hygrometricum]|uniref:Vesicle-associated protein 2-2-like n=1 Tax=Dorcoceras hygrometricum TaxID=472368 RepID=A0A2Z7C6E1_9LAMI|nr:vesicle-associated protein 2-2-like [Dorcoceras hygrometricum]